MTEQNYCDQKPVTMEFTFEEHYFLIDLLNHALDTIYFSLGDQFDQNSERYRMIEKMKDRSVSSWSERFDNVNADR